MQDTTSRTNIRNGMDVYGSDDEQVGTVAEVGDNYVLVQKGLIFVKDIYIPVSAIARVGEESVWLNIPKDQVETMGWDDVPTGGGWDESADLDYGRGTATTGTTDSGVDRDRIQVHEEELDARKVSRQAGEVEVRKDVVEEHQSMEVPVTREEVRVRRVPVDRDATPDDTAFRQEGDTIRVPVMEEDVEVTTRPRVTEEIEIEKVTRQDTKQASGTVRKERVDVSGAGDVRQGDGRSTTGTGYATGATADSTSRRGRDDIGGDDEGGTEAMGAGAGALGGAAVGGAVGGPPGAVVGGVVGAAGGALAGESAEGDDEAGSAAGGAGGTLAGAAIGGAVAGPPGAVVGGAVGAGAGAGAGDEAEEQAKGQEDDR